MQNDSFKQYYNDWSRKIENPNYIGLPVPFQIKNENIDATQYYENFYSYDPHYLNSLHGYRDGSTKYTVTVAEGYGLDIGPSATHPGCVVWGISKHNKSVDVKPTEIDGTLPPPPHAVILRKVVIKDFRDFVETKFLGYSVDEYVRTFDPCISHSDYINLHLKFLPEYLKEQLNNILEVVSVR